MELAVGITGEDVQDAVVVPVRHERSGVETHLQVGGADTSDF